MVASFFYSQNNSDLFAVFWTTIIPASFSLAILTGASNALNQVTDIKADKISKSYRPLPKGIVSIKEALFISVVLYIVAISLAVFINLMFLLFVLLIVFFTVTYSIPPRLKDVLFLNQLWVGIPRGLLGILASWSVFGNVFQPLPITIGIIAMVFLIGGSITKDIIDCKADKKTGTKTLINTYGLRKSAIMAFPFMFFPFAFIPILVDSGLLDIQFWLLTLLAVPSFFVFYLMIRGNKKGKRLENTSSWALMYVTYFSLAFGFSILTITGNLL
jgi:4-hydroxybenzoate polyprenyltransferase